jgi:pSer/pThr/pTyr-binding forkhead associated (FHA) protein
MGSISVAPTHTVQLLIIRGKHEGEAIPVHGGSFLIGRDASCQLRPTSMLVSRRHAEIRVEGDGVVLRDLGSRNGTLVNGESAFAPVPLEDGDRVEIGPLAFVVSIQPADPAAVADRPPSDDEVSAWLRSDDEGPETWSGPTSARSQERPDS